MKRNSFNVLFFIKWKIHAILTLLGNLDLPTFGNNMIWQTTKWLCTNHISNARFNK